MEKDLENPTSTSSPQAPMHTLQELCARCISRHVNSSNVLELIQCLEHLQLPEGGNGVHASCMRYVIQSYAILRERRTPEELRQSLPAKLLEQLEAQLQERRLLGSSGLDVTDVCMGTMTFGEQNSEAEAHELLSYASDCGVNFIDTAELYPVAPRPETCGASSRIVGRWLARQRRDQFVVASKVTGRSSGLDWIPSLRTDPPGPRSQPRVDAKSIVAAAEAELRRLNTDYLDLLQLHWPDRYVPMFGPYQYRPGQQVSDAAPFAEQVEAVGRLIKAGKVRAWGLSNESAFGVMSHHAAAVALGVPPPASLQNHYSLLERTYEGALAEVCHSLGMCLLPWSPLAGGSLSGKYLGQTPHGSRFDLFGERYARFNSPRVRAAVAKYAALAVRAGLQPAQLAYAFCRSRWFVGSTIIGATSLQQLQCNMETFTRAGAPVSEQGLPSEESSGGKDRVGVWLSEEVLKEIQDIHLQQRNPALTD